MTDATRMADLRVRVQGGLVTVQGLKPIPAPFPWALALAVKLRGAGASKEDVVAAQLLGWVQAHPELHAAWRRAQAALPEADEGALVSVTLASDVLERPVESWWCLRHGRLSLLAAEALEPGQLRRARLGLRLRSAGGAILVRAALVSSLVHGITPTGMPFAGSIRALDAALYSWTLLLAGPPLPRPMSALRVIYVPEVASDQARTDRAFLARLLEATLDQGAAVIGLDLWLDSEGPSPEAAARLAATLCARRDRVIAIEYPWYEGYTGDTHLVADRFRAALRRDNTACAPLPEQAAQVAFGGVWDVNEGRPIFQTRLRMAGGGASDSPSPRDAGSLAQRWGTPSIPLLGAELYWRWCAQAHEPGGCWEALRTWDRPIRVRLPDPRSDGWSLRLPADVSAWPQDRLALALRPLALQGAAVLVGSWDPWGDALPVPAWMNLGEGFEPDAIPGVVNQAAVAHTLATRDAPWRLEDAVDRRLGARQDAGLGWAAAAALTGLWSLVFGALYVWRGAGARAAGLLLALVLGVGGLSLRYLDLWLPSAQAVTAAGVLWALLAFRRARRGARLLAVEGGLR